MTEARPSRVSAPELFVVVVATIVYLATACRFVLGGDSAEFATLLASGGVAHPPGFPLYVLALRALRWLPASSPAHAAAIVTALFGAGSVLAVARASRAWSASAGASAVAAAAYASSAISWKLSTHAEVFAPGALFAALLLIASAPGVSARGTLRAALLGLSAGLALSTHTALVLFAPVGVWAFARAVQEASRRAQAVAAGVAALGLGLLPYATLLFMARHADPQTSWLWGDVHDVGSLFDHFRRAEYGSLQLSLRHEAPNPAAHVPRLLSALAVQLLGLPIVALLAGARWVGVRARREATARERWRDVTSLGATFALAGPILAAFFNRPLGGTGGLFIERFYLMPMVPLAVLCALGLDALLPRIVAGRWALATAPLALFAGLAISAQAVGDYSRPTLQFYMENALACAPKNAVVLGLGDDRFGGYLYARLALGLRRDVQFVAPKMLYAPWYRERMSRQLGLELIAPEGTRLDVAGLVQQLLAAGRPVALSGFVAKGLDRSFPSYPLGPLIIVVPSLDAVPTPDELESMNLRALSTFRVEGAPPASDDAWGGSLQADYATPWFALASAFERAGEPDRAASSLRRALALAPWLAGASTTTPAP